MNLFHQGKYHNSVTQTSPDFRDMFVWSENPSAGESIFASKKLRFSFSMAAVLFLFPNDWKVISVICSFS